LPRKTQTETSRAVAFSDPLIAQLDPERGYGDLTFEQVVEGVQSGAILIEPGSRLPVLRNRATGHPLKGSGQPPQTGVSVQQAALREFRERAQDDLPEAYDLLVQGMRSGDPRFHKIYFENLLGKMGEIKGGDAMVEAFKVFIAAMQRPEVRTVIIDQ
jgi:hypothetical protein